MLNVATALQHTKFHPYWLDTLNRTEPGPSLTEDTSTDLLIIGGGFTGLWAAVQAKELQPDRVVMLIEANTIAVGASGRPGAILSTSLMHGMSNASRLYPDELAELEALGKSNMDGFRATIERYKIDCDVEWSGELTVAVGAHGVQDIAQEYQLYKQHGHDAHLLDAEQLEAEIKSPLFAGGLWSKQRSGIINPAKLAWGLKLVAEQLGVRIFENTPMLRSHRLIDRVMVSTPKATISAAKIILATNAFTKHTKKVASRVAAIRDRIIMTEPLTDEQLSRIGWQNRQGIYDTRTQLNYMRLTRDNRILFGGRLGYFFNNETDPQEDKTAKPFLPLAEAFVKTFPTLHDVSFSHAWSGPIALTTRMAVHFQHYHQGRMIYAGGYSGFGVTASRFAARVALAIVDDVDIPERQLTFAKTLPTWIPPEPFRWLGAKITMYALDTCDDKKGWRLWWLKMIDAIGFPLKP